MIAIDGVIFQLQKAQPRGIYRMWYEIVNHLVKSLGDNILIIERESSKINIEKMKTISIPDFRFKSISDRSILQRVQKECDVDVFLSTYYTYMPGTINLQTIYDVIPEQWGGHLQTCPSWFDKLHNIKRANHFISITDNTKDELCSLYKIPQEKVDVVYLGVSDFFHPVSKDEINKFKSKYRISKDYILLVGDRTSYKEYDMFFKAFNFLPYKNDMCVVSVGSHEKELLHQEKEVCPICNYVYTGNISNEELRVAYSGAKAFAFMSKYEDFGLPVLEAMACGCPVIASHKLNPAEVFFQADSNDIQQTILTLNTILEDTDIRKSLIEQGLNKVKEYTWNKTAIEYERIINKCLTL